MAFPLLLWVLLVLLCCPRTFQKKPHRCCCSPGQNATFQPQWSEFPGLCLQGCAGFQAASVRSASSTAQRYPWSPGPQWFCLCQESHKIVFKQDLPASSTLPTPVHTNYRHSKPFNGKNEPCCLLSFSCLSLPRLCPHPNFISLSPQLCMR